MPVNLTEKDEAAIETLEGLILQGEKFREITEHPGRSRDLMSWINSALNAADRYYGSGTEMASRMSAVVFFPRWFREGHHGGEVPATEQVNRGDKATAVRVLLQGTAEALGVLDTMKNDISINGLPSNEHRAGGGTLIDFKPVLHQEQTQAQSQEQAVELKQKIENAVKVIEQNYGADQADQAKQLLEEMEKNPSTWENVRKTTGYLLNLGRDAFIAALPALIQVLNSPGA